MLTSNKKTARSKASAAFTLVEVMMAIGILVLAMSGMIYGYVQTNYQAEWSSMSLAVQALTVQSVEQARAARWDVYTTLNAGTTNEFVIGKTTNIFANAIVLPSTGGTLGGTNGTLTVTNILGITSITTIPAVRQIRSDSTWYFPSTGKWFTNTVITYRSGS
jgi:type II secretory pathway pseudopilin PulG